MKSTVIIISLLLLPFVIYSQSIEKSGKDEFTGNPIIWTSWTGLSAKAIFPTKYSKGIDFMLRYEDSRVFLHLKWYESINRINKDSELLLKMSNGSILTLHAITDFDADIYVYTNLDKSHSQNNIHVVYEGDLSALAGNDLVEKIRLNTIYGSRAFELNEKNAQKLSKAYKLIMDEIEKID